MIFLRIYSHCQNFSWNQSSKPLLLKLKYCLEKKHYRDCNEYIRLSLDFILAAKIETKRIDLLEAEQIALELSKFQSSIKIYLYSSGQMFQFIYVVQCVSLRRHEMFHLLVSTTIKCVILNNETKRCCRFCPKFRSMLYWL